MRLIDADSIPWLVEGVGDIPVITKEEINAMPTVEAVPVRHGKWELAKDGWYCSACELYPPFDCDPEEKGIPYCPNCGARMDERRSV